MAESFCFSETTVGGGRSPFDSSGFELLARVTSVPQGQNTSG